MLFTQTTLEVFWLTLYKKFFEGQVSYIYFEFLKTFRTLNSLKNCHIQVWIHSRLEWNHTNLEWIHSTYEWIHVTTGIPINIRNEYLSNTSSRSHLWVKYPVFALIEQYFNIIISIVPISCAQNMLSSPHNSNKNSNWQNYFQSSSPGRWI